MSFTLDMQQIIQYAYNIFASADTVIFLYIGAAFGIYILSRLLSMAKG